MSQSFLKVANTMHHWYYMKKGMFNTTQEGPIEEPTFVKLAVAGELAGSTLISSPTRTKNQWVEASTIPTLMAKINDGNAKRKLAKQESKEAIAAEKERGKLDKARMKSEAQQREQELALQEQQAAQPVYAPAPQQQPHTTIVINQQRQSNALPVVLNALLFPGLGQLVQGRVFTAMLLGFFWVLSIVLCFFIIGFIMLPIVWLVAVADAAMFKGN